MAKGKKKKILKQIMSLEKQVKEHRGKIGSEPESIPAVSGYWEKEVVTKFTPRIEELTKRLGKKKKDK
ncbi:MAG: hypothetical protein ACI83O_000134 [Patescibacteria group bacterium]|jgi:hypothetical protein